MSDGNKGNWLTCFIRWCGNSAQTGTARRGSGYGFAAWCSVVYALILLFIATPAYAGVSVQLDWDSVTWPSGSLSETYTDIGIGDLVMNITGDTGYFNNGTPQDNQFLTGGLSPAEDSLHFRTNYSNDAVNAEVVLTIDFTHFGGVSDVSFTVFDVDSENNGSGNDFTDQVEVTATDGASTYNPSSITVVNPAYTRIDLPNTVTGIADLSDTQSAEANASFTFDQTGITQLVITYRNLEGPRSSRIQYISLHDFYFSYSSPDLTTSTKGVTDLNGGDAEPGDTLRYTITLSNIGDADATGVSVTDNIPSNVENFNVVSFPAGATNNSLGPPAGANNTGYLDITDITIGASTSEIIVFDVDILSTAADGAVISNTVDIDDPNGPDVSVDAPDVIVNQSQIPGSGNKPLYLYGSSGFELSRTPPAGTPGAINLAKGDSQAWILEPASAAELTLESGTIPISLWLTETGWGSSRNVRVTLSYIGAASGTIGSDELTGIPLGSTPTEVTFHIDLSSDVTLPAGTRLVLTVENTTSGWGGRNVQVYPVAGSNYSLVNLNSLTVINVDSVDTYDAAYPGGSLITSTTPGATVYFRSVVSDPFGSFDISGATIETFDPNGTPVVSGEAMTEVNDSGAATKTYEYSYTVPAGPDGTWTARVTANEGTEGDITHTGLDYIQVVTPDIILMKSVLTYSDPVNSTSNPKAIPGAEMLYTIQATNQGGGAADADTVMITDPIPAHVALFVSDINGPGSGPFLFEDGTTSSGLTYTFTGLSSTTDDVGFSSNGGATYTYTPIPDGDGFDGNVTHVRINPKGSFNGSSGGNNPSFALKFKARVE